ncbi:hypothetical protein GCM10009555_096840 [Acrocarpospora macrocephala]|uniref:HTH tetR-type domain-containing protein n=1 Tax=Acrocarpospora macrocephala TaxID=150177 RepID=A0A5M3WQ34_9ACTN|nr:TetR/AcrR family transcriptional regulator [Acrocarpospora macrocephala]GES09371.1 hypothetical protein Amac_029670 [Acrocarpospora macrocephala]
MTERDPLLAEAATWYGDGRSPEAGDWRSRVVGHSLGDATDKAVERGRALIAAASRLIMRSGGADFSVQNVATEAGVSLRILYRHFTGRDDLLVALVEETNLVLARLVREHAKRFSDPLDRLGAALFFATDARQHTDASYNAAMTRLILSVSVNAGEAVGRARRPLIAAFAALIRPLVDAKCIEPGDPEELAGTITRCYLAFQNDRYLGSAVGGAPLAQERFIRFCIRGLGAETPPGWEERFRLSEEEIEISRLKSAEISGVIRQPGCPIP